MTGRRPSYPLALRDTFGMTKRNTLRIVRKPQMLAFGAIQPALLLVLFRYVLGGAIKLPSGRYGTVSAAPRLPKALSRLALRISRRGRCLAMDIRVTTATCTLLEGEPLTILHHKQTGVTAPVLVGDHYDLGPVVGTGFHEESAHVRLAKRSVALGACFRSWFGGPTRLASRRPPGHN